MASRNSPLNPRVHFDNFRSWLDLEGKAEQPTAARSQEDSGEDQT